MLQQSAYNWFYKVNLTGSYRKTYLEVVTAIVAVTLKVFSAVKLQSNVTLR